MRNETRLLFNAFCSRIGEINSVDNVTAKFTVAPTVQQTLEDKVQESSAFLQAINVVGVPELRGELLGLGVGGLIAGRTDTSGAGTRQTRDPSNLDDRQYELVQTNFDSHIRYAKLDQWAKFPDFQVRIANHIIRKCALDRIAIGFNGVSAAATGAGRCPERSGKTWRSYQACNSTVVPSMRVSTRP